MLTGVEILLERMKTNPEEFLGIDGSYSKWGRVMHMGREFFTEEERKSLDIGLIGAIREAFNGEVLRVLTGGDEPEPAPYPSPYAVTSGAMLCKNPSKIMAPSSMVNEATQTINEQFAKYREYAKQKGE